ncbi:MAG: thioredoxin family protein [Burkholderiales bacterium]|nr:thioredoxin family protein [Burkholderiales bacterium]
MGFSWNCRGVPACRVRYNPDMNAIMSSLPFVDGLAAFVKRNCPTCVLIAGEMQRVARELPHFHVVSQDDPQFPAAIERVVDDRELEHSWTHQIEATPTLIRFEGGQEKERVMGWDREAWRRLTGIADLGKGLPKFQPG